MAAVPQPVLPPRWSAGRIVALVIGVVLVLPALGLLLAGGVLLWADTAGRTDGFVYSETDDFSTDGYALTSERIDLSAGADWLPLSASLGTARAEVISTDGVEVFVGLAPVAEAAAYLDGVERAVIDDLGSTGVDEVPVLGGPPSGLPGAQDFWVASASGPGTQRLDWEPAEGDWVFVVMNADGSADVEIDVRIGATLPALGGFAWSVLGIGLLLLVVGVLLLVVGIRRPVQYVVPPSAGPASAGHTSWTPPAPVDRTSAADAQPDSARTTGADAQPDSAHTDRPPSG